MFTTDTTEAAGKLQFSLKVDFPKGLTDNAFFKAAFNKYSKEIANEARDFWMSEAGRRLTTSRQRYQDSITLASAGDGVFILSIDDPLAVAVETGAKGFDMKPGLMGKVVPMNLNREIVVTNPTFRTVTPQGNWIHPGWEGKHIVDDVIEEIVDKIVPKYVDKIIEEMFK